MEKWFMNSPLLDELSNGDVGNIIKNELAKPAEEIDMDLIRECLLILHPDMGEPAPNREQNWIALQAAIKHEKRRFSTHALRSSHKRLPMVSVVAGILIMVILLATTIAYALGINVWEHFIRWNNEIFHLSTKQSGEILSETRNVPSSILGNEFVAALNRYEMHPRIPEWIPDRYQLDQVEIDDSDDIITVISALYTDGHSSLKLEVSKYDAEEIELSASYQKDEREFETYERNELTFYLVPNLENTTCIWLDAPYEVMLVSDADMSELIQILDSVH